MNYKVLYRKYRPDCFENIVGQDYIIQTLKNSIINNNTSHAYIFSGPRGTGKTSTAKVFAKAINCERKNSKIPCDECVFCKNFAENPDVIEIDAASNNGVDQIRELIENVKLAPTNGKYKIYIIDEVHMLTTSAFNALLLTLEEPPSHVIFILATTNIENVPITILSRCQRYDFKKIDNKVIENTLKNISKKEKIGIDDDAIEEIAYLSDGGMRDALSILDQLSKKKEKITLETVENQIKTITQTSLNDLVDLIENNDIDNFIITINDYKNRALDYKILVKKLIDVLSIRAKNIRINNKKNRLDFKDYKNIILELSECLVKINISVDPYTILEMILLNYFSSEKETVQKKDNKVEFIEKKEEVSSDNNEINNDNLIDIRINNCFVNATKKYLEKAKELVLKVLDDSKITGKVKAVISDSEVVTASDEYIVFSMINDHSVQGANEILDDVEKIINKANKTNYKVIFVSNEKWNIEKNKYINNLKSNKKYIFIDEKEIKNTIAEPTINDVFNKDKVEII